MSNNIVPIHLRNTPQEHRRLEIIDHPFIISYFAQWYKCGLYVEYGVSSGPCLEKLLPHCKEVWGVDINNPDFNNPRLNKANFTFFRMSTREFKKVLEEKNPTIDIAFIDACHESKVVVEDFDDLFPYIIEDGLIFLHDTYPMEDKFTQPQYSHDCWKVPDIIKKKYGDKIELLTIPIMPGLTIVKKCRSRPLEWMVPNNF